MTDFADIRARAAAAREFDLPLDGTEVVCRLRTPTRHEMRQEAHTRGLARLDDSEFGLLRRYLVERCLIGWSGVRVRDVLDGATEAEGAAPLPLSPAALAAWLDRWPEHEDRLSGELLHRVNLRQQTVEDAEKNSPSASPVAERPVTRSDSPSSSA